MSGSGEYSLRLVAFSPHRDAAAIVQRLQSDWYRAGAFGALALPACVILGTAVRPLKKDELKGIACALRVLRGDRFFEAGAPRPALPGDEMSQTLGTEIHVCPLSPLLMAERVAAEFHPFSEPKLLFAVGTPGQPTIPASDLFPIRFRAGFVSNLVLRPAADGVPDLSWEWEFGLPVWLPKNLPEMAEHGR
jgi:hypothetical protein